MSRYALFLSAHSAVLGGVAGGLKNYQEALSVSCPVSFLVNLQKGFQKEDLSALCKQLEVIKA